MKLSFARLSDTLCNAQREDRPARKSTTAFASFTNPSSLLATKTTQTSQHICTILNHAPAYSLFVRKADLVSWQWRRFGKTAVEAQISGILVRMYGSLVPYAQWLSLSMWLPCGSGPGKNHVNQILRLYCRLTTHCDDAINRPRTILRSSATLDSPCTRLSDVQMAHRGIARI